MSANAIPSDEPAAPGTEPTESDSPPSTADLRRDAEAARERLSDDVDDLRHKLGLDEEAHGALSPVRRHPVTVAVAAVGATTATLISIKLARDHRKETKDYMKAAKRRRKAAAKQLSEARGAVASAASGLPKRGRKAMRRMAHR